MVAGELVRHPRMQAGIRRAAELQLVIERVGKDAGQGLAAAIQPQERHGQVGGRVQLAAPGQERLPLSVATWSIDPFEQRQNPAPGRCRFGEDREGEITRFGRKNMGQQTAAIQSKRQGDSPARQRPPGTGGALFEVGHLSQVGLGCGHQHRRLAILPQVHLEGGWIQGDGATVVLDRNPLGGAARGAAASGRSRRTGRRPRRRRALTRPRRPAPDRRRTASPSARGTRARVVRLGSCAVSSVHGSLVRLRHPLRT